MTIWNDFKTRSRPYRRALGLLLKNRRALFDLGHAREFQFSLFGEDVFLNQRFSDLEKGFYVDVGAFHPVRISNTWLFYSKGWRGINIEPNPEVFPLFDRYRPGDINVNLAVARQAGAVDFHCADEFSGINNGNYLKGGGGEGRNIRVEALPLTDILERHLPQGQAIHFMSVDCEGGDLEVLQSNDWTRFRPGLVLVEEHEDVETSVKAELEKWDYRPVVKLGLTRIYEDMRTTDKEPSSSRNL